MSKIIVNIIIGSLKTSDDDKHLHDIFNGYDISGNSIRLVYHSPDSFNVKLSKLLDKEKFSWRTGKFLGLICWNGKDITNDFSDVDSMINCSLKYFANAYGAHNNANLLFINLKKRRYYGRRSTKTSANSEYIPDQFDMDSSDDNVDNNDARTKRKRDSSSELDSNIKRKKRKMRHKRVQSRKCKHKYRKGEDILFCTKCAKCVKISID